jgi:YesN/AraC family two-component response regulator
MIVDGTRKNRRNGETENRREKPSADSFCVQSTIINPSFGEEIMLKVLLVEDNRIYRETFKENLCEYFPSMLIDEAENSEEALRRISEALPHLIFMDIRLPGMNGLQLTQKIKREFPDIRIAILTGYELPEYRQAAVQYGADGFFVKESLSWDEVKSFVESIEKTRSGCCEGTTQEG